MVTIVVSAITSIFIALASLYFGYKLALRRFRKECRHDFVKQQIRDLYSPLVSNIKRIRTSSDIRVELSQACNEAWRNICENKPKPLQNHDELFKPFKKQIEEENKRFPKYLLPIYDKMVEIFTKSYWLAEPTTQQFYQPFCRYVELWHRYIDGGIPGEVLKEIKIEEKPLEPFYADIEHTLCLLRSELAQEKERPEQ